MSLITTNAWSNSSYPMKISLATIPLVLLALASASAFACSRSPSMRAFTANQKEFQKTHDFPEALVVPMPVVKVTAVQRATSNSSGSCEAYAFVDIDVSVPESSAFKLAELGLVFRSETGKPQDAFMAFPNFPVTSLSTKANGKVAHFSFGLIDPLAARNKPFALKLDVFAINRGLQVGASTTVLITHP